jgi:hypothetical protein
VYLIRFPAKGQVEAEGVDLYPSLGSETPEFLKIPAKPNAEGGFRRKDGRYLSPPERVRPGDR